MQVGDATVCPVAGAFFVPDVFQLNVSDRACDVKPLLGFVCANGDVRDVKYLSDGIVPRVVDGNLVVGLRTVRYDVYVPGASDRVAELLVSSNVRLQRQ